MSGKSKAHGSLGVNSLACWRFPLETKAIPLDSLTVVASGRKAPESCPLQQKDDRLEAGDLPICSVSLASSYFSRGHRFAKDQLLA